MRYLIPVLFLLTACAKEEPPQVLVSFKTFCRECLSVATVNGSEVYRDTVVDAANFDRLCDPGDVVRLRSTALVVSDTAVMVALRQNGNASGLMYDQPTDSLLSVEVTATVEE